MRLTLEDGTSFDNPTPQQMAHALADLGHEGNSFAILAQDEEIYLQASADENQRCDLEYRDGSEETHFRCVNESLPLEDVIAAFTSYASGDSTWKGAFEWRTLEEVATAGASGKGRSGCASMIAAAIVIPLIVRAMAG